MAPSSGLSWAQACATTSKLPPLVPSTKTAPESCWLNPRVSERAVAPDRLISALPPLLMKASVEESGSQRSQFLSLNQSLSLPLPVQVVVGQSAQAGELQTAKAA